MSIPAVSALSAGISPVTPTAYLSSAGGAGGTTGASATGFASALGSVDQLQQMQSTTDALAVKAVTGSLTDVHDYTIAAAESKLTLELTAAVRNKAVDAFNEIMRMQA
ncbi:MAG TPA: flagellar hook-basal body complex protein FliE [Demequina sp.]|nr:flagellar hook-basal body complex protein FliE [Cellulomonas sp.]HZL80648.1 flagellar hook-basal body complex protein FliE [Demequina sp.]